MCGHSGSEEDGPCAPCRQMPYVLWDRKADRVRISSPDRYVSTGDDISFQRRNIMEVPGWHWDSFGLHCDAGVQSNFDVVAADLRRINAEEARADADFLHRHANQCRNRW